MGKLKIAIAGFQHETNTFAPMLAPYEAFVQADAWPGLTEGAEIFSAMAGKNLPVSGFIDAARRHGHELLPILWCSAEPSSYVTRDAFERITHMICTGLSSRMPVDAVYLDLHGAMVTEELEDGEGELLSRLRQIIGKSTPLVVSLDLHANVTERMVESTDGLVLFRTYPHIDMALTGERAFTLLNRYGQRNKLYKSFRKLPFLVPLSAQCTEFEPCRSIYSRLCELESAHVWSIDFATGFPPADIYECGPALVAYGSDRAQVEQAANQLYQFVVAAESRFQNPLLSADDAVQQANAMNERKPVVLADVQDNPGAGGSSDTVGLLAALVQHRAQGAVLAIMHDPEAARSAVHTGVGKVINIELGGKSGQVGQVPFTGRFKVEKLTSGKFVCSGAMYSGMETDIGPMALLRVDDEACDVRVIVGSQRMQCLDLAIFRHMGVEPDQQKMLAIKSTVHFRADFDPIASATLLVEAPGAHPCRLSDIDYKNLRSGVRLGPMGPVFPGNRPGSDRFVV